MKKCIVFLLLSVVTATVYAQAREEDAPEEFSKANLGFGLGVDYGGFGARIAVLPSKNFGLFGGLGYNLDGLGYNLGAEAKLAPSKRACPTLLAMYGYNGVIIVKDAEDYNKTYYGVTIGAGVEVKSRNNQNFWNFELLVPFRSQDFKDDLDALQNTQGIEINDPLPIAFSVAYHISF